MFLQALLLIFSMIILFFGASMALEAAERIGKCLGLSSLVIGSLIIGFGTSLPEFFVSQLACIRGHNEIALGNIIGSNIANLLLVLGVAGIMVPLRTNHISVQKQFIIHLLLTLLLVGVVGYFPNFILYLR